MANVVQAHVLAAYALLSAPPSSSIPVDQRVDGEAFLITDDEPVRFWDFARALGAAAGIRRRRRMSLSSPNGWGSSLWL